MGQGVYGQRMVHPGEHMLPGQHIPGQPGMIQVGPAGPYPRGMPQGRVIGPQGMRMPPQYAQFPPRGHIPPGATQRLTHMAAAVGGPPGPGQRFPVSVGKTRPTLLQDQPLLLEDLVEKVGRLFSFNPF